MNQMENNNNNKSSNSLVFGQWPQTKMQCKMRSPKFIATVNRCKKFIKTQTTLKIHDLLDKISR